MSIDKISFQESEVKCLILQLMKGVILPLFRWTMHTKNLLFTEI